MKLHPRTGKERLAGLGLMIASGGLLLLAMFFFFVLAARVANYG